MGPLFRKLIALLLLSLLQVQLASGVALACRHADQPGGKAHAVHCPDDHRADRPTHADADGGPTVDCPKCDLAHLWSGYGVAPPLRFAISVHRFITEKPNDYLNRYRFDPDLVHRPPIAA